MTDSSDTRGEARAEAAEAQLVHPAAAKAQRTLLIVDDEPDLAPILHRLLRDHFTTVLEASNAAQALAHLKASPVTHVVLDASLPDGVSGQGLAQQLRTLFPSVRYLALFSGSPALEGAMLPGVDQVFIKPSGFDALLQTLKAGG